MSKVENTLKLKQDTEVCDEFTQSQGHGFVWENDIREKVFGLKKNKNDTNVHDISSEELGTTENISIKATSCDTVYCGDIIRYAFGYDFREKHTMMIVKYKQTGDTKTISCVYEIDYTKEMNTYLFNNIKKEDLVKYIETIKREGRNFNYKSEARRLENDNNLKATIHPKVDSGKQRRVQTSFKITQIERDLPQCVKYKSPSDKPNLIRDKEITLSIKSGVRARNKTHKEENKDVKSKNKTIKFSKKDMISILQEQPKKDSTRIAYSKLNNDGLRNAVVSLVENKNLPVINKTNIIISKNMQDDKQNKYDNDDTIVQAVSKYNKEEVTDILNNTITDIEVKDETSTILDETIEQLQSLNIKEDKGGKKKTLKKRHKKQVKK
tara:strand:- start:74 stop:1216 length:1143 start_codon:yes stop_codon:yes gene_type:complete